MVGIDNELNEGKFTTRVGTRELAAEGGEGEGERKR